MNNECEKHSITILVDIDDTIENLLEAWVHWLNCEYLCNVKWEEIDDWDISKFFPHLTREQVYKPLHNKELWKIVSPKPDAQKYLKLLIDEGFDIYLCTTTDYRNILPKYQYVIQQYFPYIPWQKVIVTSNKQMILADYLIDDAPHNLIGGRYSKILFSAPHNKNFNAGANNMMRVTNWEEIYEYFMRVVQIESE